MSTPDTSRPGWLKSNAAIERLADFDQALMRWASSDIPAMDAVARYLVEQGGKRIRPVLLFVAAACGQPDPERELDAAAALELVHVASLYHDDVMDQASRRRGVASVNTQWDNMTAVAGGTYLFSRAVEATAELGSDVVELCCRSWARVCAGQLHETENAYHETALDEHLQILSEKTATLFELPCQLGALIGGVDPEVAAALARYGEHLGVAFQLADDALDIGGSAEEIGKNVGVDLRHGVYSTPIVWALAQDDAAAEQARDLLYQMSPSTDDLAKVVELVSAGGAVEHTRGLAREHAASAVSELDALADGDEKESLLGLSTLVVERSS